jgi:hypothetical protein
VLFKDGRGWNESRLKKSLVGIVGFVEVTNDTHEAGTVHVIEIPLLCQPRLPTSSCSSCDSFG